MEKMDSMDEIMYEYITGQREINPSIRYRSFQFGTEGSIQDGYIILCKTKARYFISATIIDKSLDVPYQIGSLLFSINNDRCHVSLFEVDIDYQGLGVGREMMGCLKSLCAYNDVESISLTQAPSNDMKDLETGEILDAYEQREQLSEVYDHLGFKKICSDIFDNPYSEIYRKCTIDKEHIIMNTKYDSTFFTFETQDPIGAQ